MNEWISVDKMLPEKDGLYLVVNNNLSDFERWGDIATGNLLLNKTKKGWYCDSVISSRVMFITHWMPLPKPPK